MLAHPIAGAPLLAPLTIMGWPVVELWVASSDTDADVFVYLEDYDPKADKARCAVVNGSLVNSMSVFECFGGAVELMILSRQHRGSDFAA